MRGDCRHGVSSSLSSWELDPGAVLTLETGSCFYNEKVDIELDGQKLERPQTHFG